MEHVLSGVSRELPLGWGLCGGGHGVDSTLDSIGLAQGTLGSAFPLFCFWPCPEEREVLAWPVCAKCIAGGFSWLLALSDPPETLVG